MANQLTSPQSVKHGEYGSITIDPNKPHDIINEDQARRLYPLLDSTADREKM